MELTLDVTQIMLQLLGGFYTFAGFVAGRAALMSRLMDNAIAAIGAKEPDPVETRRSLWLLYGSLIILAGGGALMFLLDVAPWLFILSSIAQAIYIYVLAPRYFDVADPPDEQGRRQTTNAFIVYLVATALIVWAAANGKLLSWREVSWPVFAALGAALAVYSVYLLGSFYRPLKKPAWHMGEGVADLDDASSDPSQTRSIKVMADYDCHPLWALDPGIVGNYAPDLLGLSETLTRDLNEWADAFNSFLDRDNPADTQISPSDLATHEAHGRQLAIRLARERPDLEIYAYQTDTGVVRVYGEDAL